MCALLGSVKLYTNNSPSVQDVFSGAVHLYMNLIYEVLCPFVCVLYKFGTQKYSLSVQAVYSSAVYMYVDLYI